MRSCLGILLYFPLQWLSVSAGLTNRTIDDTHGDSVTHTMVEYTHYWNVGPTCTGCKVQPDELQAYEKTWHDTTTDSPNSSTIHSATLKFNGTAVWIYCILVNSGKPFVTIATNMTFKVDGVLVGAYEHIPNKTNEQYLYNVSVFSQTDMSMEEHVLVMSAMQGSAPSLLLFDYAVYTTYDEELSPSNTTSTTSETILPMSAAIPSVSSSSTTAVQATRHKNVPAGAIAGGIISGVAFMALIGLCLTVFLRRRQRMSDAKLKEKYGDISPFPPLPAVGSSNVFVSNRRPRRTRPPPVTSVSESTSPPTSTGTSSSFGCVTAGAVGKKGKRKHRAAVSPHQADLMRGVEHLRQQVATLRSVRSYTDSDMDLESKSTTTRARTSTTVSTLPLSRLTSAELESYLRREIATLRVQVARLTAEAQGLVGADELHSL